MRETMDYQTSYDRRPFSFIGGIKEDKENFDCVLKSIIFFFPYTKSLVSDIWLLDWEIDEELVEGIAIVSYSFMGCPLTHKPLIDSTIDRNLHLQITLALDGFIASSFSSLTKTFLSCSFANSHQALDGIWCHSPSEESQVFHLWSSPVLQRSKIDALWNESVRYLAMAEAQYGAEDKMTQSPLQKKICCIDYPGGQREGLLWETWIGDIQGFLSCRHQTCWRPWIHRSFNWSSIRVVTDQFRVKADQGGLSESHRVLLGWKMRQICSRVRQLGKRKRICFFFSKFFS